MNASSHAWNLLFAAWLVAMIATLGSLFFSEVMMFPPCVMCWYQRICMYPLTLILLVGLFPLDSKASTKIAIGKYRMEKSFWKVNFHFGYSAM